MAVAAAALAWALLAVAWWAPRPSARLGDGRSIDSYGFDLTTCLVPPETLVATEMPRDGLAALVEPAMLDPAEVARRNREGRGKFLLPHDRVVGVSLADDARAYPLLLLRWHEVVNDTVGGVPVVITYNPLCDAVVVAERTVDGAVLSFGVSGLLSNSNLLMYDRQPDPRAASLWSQLQARAVAGPAAVRSARLRLLPATLGTWNEWLAGHPDTRVLAPIENLQRLYRRDPYHSYFGSNLLRFPASPLPPASDLALKDRVVVVSVGDTLGVFALARLARVVGASTGTFDAVVGDLPLRLSFAVDPGVATVEPRQGPPSPPPTRYAFWFAWYASHPDGPEPGP